MDDSVCDCRQHVRLGAEMPAIRAAAGIKPVKQIVETLATEPPAIEKTVPQKEGPRHKFVYQHGRLRTRVPVPDEHVLAQAIDGPRHQLINVEVVGSGALRMAQSLVRLKVVSHAKSPVEDPRAEFRRRLHGERRGDDAVCWHIIDEHELEDPRCEASCLSRPWPRHHVESGIGWCTDGIDLLRVRQEAERFLVRSQELLEGDHRAPPWARGLANSAGQADPTAWRNVRRSDPCSHSAKSSASRFVILDSDA